MNNETRNETEEQRKAREHKNAYYREWRKKNKDKVREANARYWAKQSEKARASNRSESKSEN